MFFSPFYEDGTILPFDHIVITFHLELRAE